MNLITFPLIIVAQRAAAEEESGELRWQISSLRENPQKPNLLVLVFLGTHPRMELSSLPPSSRLTPASLCDAARVDVGVYYSTAVYTNKSPVILPVLCTRLYWICAFFTL